MTIQQTVQLAGQFFAAIWNFLKGVEVPFMQGISFAGLMVGLLVARLGLKLVRQFMDMGSSGSSSNDSKKE